MATIEELSEQVERLAARVDAAESVLAIQSLKARYGELVDARFVQGDRCLPTAWPGWPGRPPTSSPRTGCGTVVPGSASSGAGPRSPPAWPSRPLVFSRHLFVKPRIEVDGDRGSARWDLLSPCTRPDGTSLWVSGGEDDVYTRVDGPGCTTR